MLNLNIGLLGHVDSGKTSLARVLSQTASTAAFDKNPQSQSRGITLDLGFSSFCIDTPDDLKEVTDNNQVQLTLVDCPGHASLIRTIIGGAQIIDLILLIIDVTKGIQTQTAECLVIGEITCEKMIVVLNKIDLVEEDAVKKMTKRLKLALKATKFATAPVVNIAAHPIKDHEPVGLKGLLDEISKTIYIPVRDKTSPFVFAIDHCFGLKGKGTVMTGTVLQGTTSLDTEISLPALKTSKKIKSIQRFRVAVSSAVAGDRVGICVTQFDPGLMERGMACSPGYAKLIYCAVISVKRIKYFKSTIGSKSKFHITIGHETCMAVITCFSGQKFSLDDEYCYIESLSEDDCNSEEYLLLEFEKPVLVIPNCTIIGSKLDMDVHKNECRIAFWGKLLTSSNDKDYKTTFLPSLKVYKSKHKSGIVERLVNENTLIVKNLFKKETNLEVFCNLQVNLSTGERGIIESSFGQSGKIKVHFSQGLNPSTVAFLALARKGGVSEKPLGVSLTFKKYIYDPRKRILQ